MGMFLKNIKYPDMDVPYKLLPAISLRLNESNKISFKVHKK